MIAKFILPVAVMFAISSCSTAYKAGQTPDDVYYSPVNEAAQQEKENRRNQIEEYQVRQADDEYLRMKVRNRSRWSRVDDFDYWNDTRYDFCNCNCYNNFGWNPYRYQYNYFGWNPHFGWGTWRNPIYVVAGYKNPKVYTGNTSMANISAFRNKTYNNVNTNTPFIKGQTNTTSFGRLLKQAFANGSSGSTGSTESWGRPQRTFEPGTSTSSSAGGRSGGYSSSGSSSTEPRKSKN